ncbi:carbohydrate ABC transporter permease [Mycetocola zhujimingii]|nr:sugar ABC transporter permease [Mycetocola zhujimingii]
MMKTIRAVATAGAAPPPVDRRRLLRERRGRWDEKLSPYLYISPFFLVFAVVGMFPLLYTAFVAAHEWSLIGGQGEFVGFDNFTFVLGQSAFWSSLGNTISIFLFSSVPQVIVALVIANALNANLRARTFWRMGVLVPYVVAPVAVALIFSRMFADQSGFINSLLALVNVDPIGWHRDSLPAHIAIASMVNFRWTGYNALILLAAMQTVPGELYEAATIDGARRLRQFFSITIPAVRPTLIFVILTSTIGGLQIFDEPRLYDNVGLGGNSGQWRTVTLYMYELGWSQQRLGRAAAVAWLLFLCIVVFALLSTWLSSRVASAGDGPSRRKGRKSRRAASTEDASVAAVAPIAPVLTTNLKEAHDG